MFSCKQKHYELVGNQVHFRNFSPFVALSLNLLLLCQGKQDKINSKIHYLKSTRDTNELKSRPRFKNIKESKKINLDIEFINNGRPYSINSKKSKMLNKVKNKKYTTFHENEIRGGPIKQLKEPDSVGERVDIPLSPENLFRNSPGSGIIETDPGISFKLISNIT